VNFIDHTTQHEVEQFLYHEATLLDAWQLDLWFELMTPDVLYEVPPTDEARNAELATTIAVIRDDHARLRSRVEQLMKGRVLGESPFSRTRRLLTNCRVTAFTDNTYDISSNFAVHRFKYHEMESYVGRYEHRLVRAGESFKIKRRKAILDLESLSPHGKLTIIL
jgi:p-cumate 2,3-dioxygenase subunit beta